MSTTTETTTGPDGPRVVDRAQYGLAAFLAVVGVVVVVDATGLRPGFADQPVQPSFLPYVVGTALLVLAATLAVATARGNIAEPEGGEDVDLTEPSDWFTVAKLAGVFLANVLLVDTLGWAITGALLFAGCAWALGSRTLLKDVAIGAALSLITWYGFYVGLGLPIPAGILDGVL
ncbi:MAG: tripartite tricarboxylate transporter TctB family protein [Aeromicrobium erythreum]